MRKDGPEYKAKVSKLREDICAYLVEHADSMSLTQKCDKVIQRAGRYKKTVHTYGDYCDLMANDGTYMGDLEIQAFCNMCNVTVQVATDAILHDDNAVGLSAAFSPYHIVGQQTIEPNSMGTYHNVILHGGVGHFEPCIHYEKVSEKISPVEPSSEINERIDDAAEDDDGSSEHVQPVGGAEHDLASVCHVQIEVCDAQQHEAAGANRFLISAGDPPQGRNHS